MDQTLREILWKQFGASIDMFENSIKACPDKLWDSDRNPLFWYTAYHTLFFLDYYLSEEPDKFHPPEPFILSEFNSDGEMPERTYTREEILKYVDHCRKKCHDHIAGMTAEKAAERFINPYRNYSVLETLLYNMRHVQHHGAQLNLLLRQGGIEPPDWVSQTKISL
ncbi:MAG: DinB family protein [Bacteroidetes bacterium]|nr:DinB family protein [Bacteroidota bacterium]